MNAHPAAAALRVLVLEDDPMLRERILIPGLRRFGFDPHGCGSGAELQAQLRTDPADIVGCSTSACPIPTASPWPATCANGIPASASSC
ncbi:response regulator transcription factor [Xanthomonas graminis]|uniref:response regulator n=1 Tax=Xanthomonas graminis TaxID=3390026 RepID=UPI000A55C223|nr:response regulator [Xanthomonas translucens]UKE73289.1 response regulator [Xanthomonas translucens pv. phleipratensis]